SRSRLMQEPERAAAEARRVDGELQLVERALPATERDLEELRSERQGLRTQLARTRAEVARLSAELELRDEALGAHEAVLGLFGTVTRRRSRRLRSISQFLSWLLRPTPTRLGYVARYFAARISRSFDADSYLLQYPDVAEAGLNPLMHYVEHGSREGRRPPP